MNYILYNKKLTLELCISFIAEEINIYVFKHLSFHIKFEIIYYFSDVILTSAIDDYRVALLIGI